MRKTCVAAMLLTSTTLAWAQGHDPYVPVNPADTSPASALDDMPSKTIGNGIVSAKVYLPVEFGFYRSTRFDHAGMITHITYKGQDYVKRDIGILKTDQAGCPVISVKTSLLEILPSVLTEKTRFQNPKVADRS